MRDSKDLKEFEKYVNKLWILNTWKEGTINTWDINKKFSRACHRILNRLMETHRLECNPQFRGETYYGSI